MRLHGSKGKVEIGSPPVTVVSLNSFTLNMRRDRVDVTAFQDTNKVYVQGLPDISGDLGGFYDPGAGSPDNGNLMMFDIAEGDEAVNLILTPSTLAEAGGANWSGMAFLDSSISVSATGAITLSGSFVAAGPWTRA